MAETSLVFDWPPGLGANGVSFDPVGMGVSGPRTLTGTAQFASTDTGFWIAQLSGVSLYRGERVRLFRALRAQLDGGAHHVRVPVMDSGQAPWPGSERSVDPLPTGDDEDDTALFDDGTGWHQPVITVMVSAAAAAGATQLVVDLVNASELDPGAYFSIGDRLYVIAAIVAVNGTERTLAIRPRLREAVAIGAQAEFDNPVCRMKLASEDEMAVLFGLLWRAKPDVAFVEVAV